MTIIRISKDFKDDICEHLGRIRKIAKDIEEKLEDYSEMDMRGHDDEYDRRYYNERRMR